MIVTARSRGYSVVFDAKPDGVGDFDIGEIRQVFKGQKPTYLAPIAIHDLIRSEFEDIVMQLELAGNLFKKEY